VFLREFSQFSVAFKAVTRLDGSELTRLLPGDLVRHGESGQVGLVVSRLGFLGRTIVLFERDPDPYTFEFRYELPADILMIDLELTLEPKC